MEEQGFRVATKLVLGLPQIEIHRLAAESDCTFIVVGSQGRSTLGQRFLGGVASTIIQSATRPVLIVRAKWQELDGSATVGDCACNPLGHVIFPTDFSENADHAFSYAEKIVASGATRVTLAHVQDKSRIEKHLASRREEFDRIDRDRLERLRTRLKEISDIEVELEIPYGNPAEEILRIADERGPDALIVMGSQGRGFWAEVFLGSVSLRMAHRASVPVLLVPALR